VFLNTCCLSITQVEAKFVERRSSRFHDEPSSGRGDKESRGWILVQLARLCQLRSDALLECCKPVEFSDPMEFHPVLLEGEFIYQMTY